MVFRSKNYDNRLNVGLETLPAIEERESFNK